MENSKGVYLILLFDHKFKIYENKIYYVINSLPGKTEFEFSRTSSFLDK